MGTNTAIMQRSLCIAFVLLALVAVAQCSSSTTPSGTTPSPPPPSTAGQITITQRVVFSFTHTTYTGLLKALVEKSYGKAIGIYTSAGGYVAGCTVASVAVARRASAVTFTATVSSTQATAARSAATSLTTATLNTHIAAVKAAESAYSGVTTPVVTGVDSPTITGGTTSGSSKVEVGMAALVGSALLALSMRH